MVFLFLTLFALFSSFSLSATAGDGKDEIQHESSSSVTTLVHNITPIGDENDEVNEETTPTSAASSSPSAATPSVTAGTVGNGDDEEEQTSAASSSNANRPNMAVRSSLKAPHLPKVDEPNWVIYNDTKKIIKLGSDYISMDDASKIFEKDPDIEYIWGDSRIPLHRKTWEYLKSKNERPITIAVNKIFAVAVGIPTSAISLTANALYKTAESIYGFPLTIKTAAASLLTRLCKRKDK